MPDGTPCLHPKADFDFFERSGRELTECTACGKWADESQTPIVWSDPPLPPIKRTRKPKADPPALKTNAKSLAAVAEMRERYLAAGGKGRVEIRALLAPDGELTFAEVVAIMKKVEPLTDSDAALLDMIFDAIDAEAAQS